MLIIGGSGSGKTNALFHLIKDQDSDNLIDQIYLYTKDLNELKYLNDSKAFIEHLNTMDDI